MGVVCHSLYDIFLQGKWEVPLPKVKAQSEAEVFRVVKTGKTKSKEHTNKSNSIEINFGLACDLYGK